MEIYNPPAAEIRELAGNIRLLAYLMRPASDKPGMEREPLITMLELIATDLDRVAEKTEPCPICSQRTSEEGRP